MKNIFVSIFSHIKIKSLVLIILPLCVVSCDKVEYDNPFRGQWQVLEWVDATGTTVATNEIQMYYSFQLGIISFQHVRGQAPLLLHARYETSANQLYISKPFEYAGNGHDKELPMSILSQFGVPADGVFVIEEQTSTKIVLRSNETGTIILRKY
jgi:hypothetical protein